MGRRRLPHLYARATLIAVREREGGEATFAKLVTELGSPEFPAATVASLPVVLQKCAEGVTLHAFKHVPEMPRVKLGPGVDVFSQVIYRPHWKRMMPKGAKRLGERHPRPGMLRSTYVKRALEIAGATEAIAP